MIHGAFRCKICFAQRSHGELTLPLYCLFCLHNCHWHFFPNHFFCCSPCQCTRPCKPRGDILHSLPAQEGNALLAKWEESGLGGMPPKCVPAEESWVGSLVPLPTVVERSAWNLRMLRDHTQNISPHEHSMMGAGGY